MLLLLFISTLAWSGSDNRHRIGVIDTGLNVEDSRFRNNICGFRDLTGEGIADVVGHGTHVTGLIQKYAEKSNYCLIIYKFYSAKVSNGVNYNRQLAALHQAVKEGVEIINVSGGGQPSSEQEMYDIKTHPEITIVAAVGNENKDLAKYQFYPASYTFKNVIAVGALSSDGKKAEYSNYGKRVDVWEQGSAVSTLPCNEEGYMSGTSMATGIHTGKLIKERYEFR